MPNPTWPTRQQYRTVLLASTALAVVAVAAVLAFAWPAARIAPRGLPVGIVGVSPAAQHAVVALDDAQPGGFDFRLYPDADAARSAIEHRTVYGAFAVTTGAVTVLEADAAAPTVAQLLTTAGGRVAEHGRVPLRVVDVVPLSADDPRGTVLSSALLPLTICASVLAAAVAIVMGMRSAWRQVVVLAVVSGVIGLGVYVIAQTFLGALPHEPVASWAALSLTVLAMAVTAAGLAALVGPVGLGLAAAVMVFVGNAFAGTTSAPELLPGAAHHLGQWLPPGAGANLLRSTAYFDGAGSAGHLTVLLVWVVVGSAAAVMGHHTPLGHRSRTRTQAPRHETPDPAGTRLVDTDRPRRMDAGVLQRV